MEGFFVLQSKNEVVGADNHKVERAAKHSIGSSGRKMLADISNMPQRPSTLIQDNKPRPSSISIKEYIEQLQKENATLMKLLADKDKLIELSGAELQKLRVSLQKMQLQNLQLAKANSQMLAELNSGKDRLKDLQHQLGCKNGLLIAKKLELEGKVKSQTCHINASKKVKISQHEETGVCMVTDRDNDKHSNTSHRKKSKSLGSSVRKAQDNDMGDNERPWARRQSARFKRDEPKPTQDSFKINNDLPPCPLFDRMQEDDSNSAVSSVHKDDGEEDDSHEGQERRSSLSSRPSRQAAKKVQSYKEMRLNVKMRRPE